MATGYSIAEVCKLCLVCRENTTWARKAGMWRVTLLNCTDSLKILCTGIAKSSSSLYLGLRICGAGGDSRTNQKKKVVLLNFLFFM